MNLKFDKTAWGAGVNRWAHLTGARLVDDAKPLGLAAAVVAGINLVTLVLFREPLVVGASWAFLVVLASVIVATTAFRTMHSGRSTTDFLLWPATSLEKYAAALAETLIVPLALTVVALVLSVVLGLVGAAVGASSAAPWLPWEGTSFGDVAALGVFLLVVLTGAATFRKHALWKTGLVIIALGFVVTLVAAGVFGAWGHGAWDHRSFRFLLDDRGFEGHRVGTAALGAMEVLAKLWYFGVVPVFCLVFGWAQVHEKEAGDEVQ